MAGPVNFRVLFGGEDDARKLTIQSGIPKSVEELTPEIKTFFGVAEDVRLQFKDVDFGNEFMNLLSISDIQDQSTFKVVYFPCESTSCYPTIPVSPSSVCTNCSLQQSNNLVSSDSYSSSDTIILSSPESWSCSWPEVFVMPRFSYCAEMMLQKGHDDFKANGTLLPRKSDLIFLKALQKKSSSTLHIQRMVSLKKLLELWCRPTPVCRRKEQALDVVDGSTTLRSR